MWNALTPEAKEPFNQWAAEDSKRYCLEYEAETKRNGGKRLPTASGAKRMMTNQSIKGAKKVSDPNKKKQPLSGFFRYVQFRRLTLKTMPTEVAKICGGEWKLMSDEEKKKWSTYENAQAAQDAQTLAEEGTTNDT